MKFGVVLFVIQFILSPPSRGAWIEIVCVTPPSHLFQSPPSRGAWIEMNQFESQSKNNRKVAPLAGGVD